MSRTSSRFDLRFIVRWLVAGGWWRADYQPPATSHQPLLLFIRPLHTLNENLIERRRDHFELGDSRAAADQLLEQRLRIGAVLQEDLCMIAVGCELLDQRIVF